MYERVGRLFGKYLRLEEAKGDRAELYNNDLGVLSGERNKVQIIWGIYFAKFF